MEPTRYSGWGVQSQKMLRRHFLRLHWDCLTCPCRPISYGFARSWSVQLMPDVRVKRNMDMEKPRCLDITSPALFEKSIQELSVENLLNISESLTKRNLNAKTRQQKELIDSEIKRRQSGDGSFISFMWFIFTNHFYKKGKMKMKTRRTRAWSRHATAGGTFCHGVC